MKKLHWRKPVILSQSSKQISKHILAAAWSGGCIPVGR
jgi:hypothetical protein